jgi:hypothetical protein
MKIFEVHYWFNDLWDSSMDHFTVFECEAEDEEKALEKFHKENDDRHVVQFVKEKENEDL